MPSVKNVVSASCAARSCSDCAGRSSRLAMSTLRWMPSSPSGAWRPIASVMTAPTSPPCDVVRIAEALHQLRPGSRDAAGAPTDFRGLAGEAVAGDGRQDEVECVLGGSAVRGRVGEWADGFEQLDNRAGPAVRHDQRQRVLVLGAHVDEVDVHPVDLGRELRQRVESPLDPAKVVVLYPVAVEVVDLLVRDIDAEGADTRGRV